VSVFNFNSNEVRTIEKDNQIWFVATDVCTALNVKNSTQAVSRLDEDERSMFNIGRQGDASIINESGLYSLILSSRKASAKLFKKWVTSEVLPAIRKTGSYTAAPALPYLITVEQQGLIHTAVGERFPEGKARPYAWSRFNAHFKIASYKHLPAPRFDEALAYIATMPGKSAPLAPLALPVRIPVRQVGDLSFFWKSGRKQTAPTPDGWSLWWDYPQHLKELEWSKGHAVGEGFFNEVIELYEHDEQAAYTILTSVIGNAWGVPAVYPARFGAVEQGFTVGMVKAMMLGLAAMKRGEGAYVPPYARGN